MYVIETCFASDAGNSIPYTILRILGSCSEPAERLPMQWDSDVRVGAVAPVGTVPARRQAVTNVRIFAAGGVPSAETSTQATFPASPESEFAELGGGASAFEILARSAFAWLRFVPKAT